MNNLKVAALVLFLLIASYTYIASSTSKLAPENTLCKNAIIKHIAPWSSGCFYTAYFNSNPSDDLLVYEKEKLDNFAKKGGLASDVLWYRSVFHQRFQYRFKTSFQEIHEMHTKYTKAEHIRVDFQIDYLSFLYKSDLIPLAQTSLNNYCNTFVPSFRSDIVDEINWRIKQKELPLSLDHCRKLTAS